MKTIDIRQISKIPEIRRVEGPKDSYKCLFCQNKPKSNLGREKKHIHFIQHMQICNGNRGKLLYEEIVWNKKTFDSKCICASDSHNMRVFSKRRDTTLQCDF